MKKLLSIFGLCWCIFAARAQTTALLQYKYTGPAWPMCCSVNTYCQSHIICGSPFCYFNASALDFMITYSTSNPGGTLGANPFRFKFEIFLNGSTVIASTVQQRSTTFCAWPFPNTPIVSGQYRAKILFQKRNITGWVNVSTDWSNIININLCPPPPCGTSIVVSGNPFTTPLTQSTNWIATSGSTVIPAATTVKFDANPANGFVELNDGFETQTGSLFIAQALDGCGIFVPSLPHPGGQEVVADDQLPGKAVNKGQLMAAPNPTNGRVTIRHGTNVTALQVFTAEGILLTTLQTRKTTATQIDMSNRPPGIYIIKADDHTAVKLVKQ